MTTEEQKTTYLISQQIEETHIMENIIYNELRYRGYQVDVGTRLKDQMQYMIEEN